MTPASTNAPPIVLDSNVVLDWLVFRDPSSRAVAAAITSGRLRWVATPAMLEELEHVLTRGSLSAWQPDVDGILAHWHAWAAPVAPAPAAPFGALRCTDPDDQKFIDLALHAGAVALLSRDRAVLKLARRAHRFGLRIQTAAAWARALAPEFAQ